MNLSRRQKIGLSTLGTGLAVELAAVAFWTSNEIANDPIDCTGREDKAACIADGERQRASDQIPALTIGATAVVLASIGGAITLELISKKDSQNTDAATLTGSHENSYLTVQENELFDQIVRDNNLET